MDTIFSSLPAEPASLVEILQWRAIHQSERLAFTFLADGESNEVHITYAELDHRARRIAAHLRECHASGERVLLLYHPGLQYIEAFFGCLYAGAIAVPIYPPKLNRNMARLTAILSDAQPTVALTTTPILSTLQRRFADNQQLQALRWETTDTLPDKWTESDQRSLLIKKEMIAFLQYTSGSTGTPKGVMLSHGNLVHNSSLLQHYFRFTSETRCLIWLPPYHDMGLIGGILQPIYAGFYTILMPPAAFLQQPLRWLETITRYRATLAGGPNFAFELCASKATPQQLATFDLSSLTAVFSGAEPIRLETMDRFTATFAPCGFRKETLHFGYGLAEATLFVSGSYSSSPVAIQRFNETLLMQNYAVPTNEKEESKVLISCGPGVESQHIVIVDPVMKVACPPGQIGEIWVAGPSVAQGYWQRPQETEEVFHAYLSDANVGPFLRTGDLGFFYQEELFITGRLKDLIIIRGRNLYPQDIEITAERSHPALRHNSNAAFAIEGASEERLVIVQEIERQYRHQNTQEIVDAIRQAVIAEYDVEVFAVVLLKAGSIFKTSSGKIQRYACRQGFLEGHLDVVCQWIKEDVVLEYGDSSTRPTKPAKENITGWLVEQIARQAKIKPEQVDIHASFDSYGLDSLAAISISGEMEQWLECRLSPTLIYDYPTIEVLADHLAAETPIRQSFFAANQKKHSLMKEPIAVIGIGCRFPGASTPELFWKLLASGVDAINTPSSQRLAISRQYDSSAETSIAAQRAGFLESVDCFDPGFFGISPREAIQVDPQQRLLLEVAWEALENAGIPSAQLARSRTGVFIGISSDDYSRLPLDITQSCDTYAATGNALSIAANRLSYLFNLQGPSLAIDTACSSSLVAIHLACQSLRLCESQVALAGGVNLILSPKVTMLFSQAHMLAEDGRCKTFDARADGYVRGEGCGIVVLKRYSDALRDGDHILALIRGSAVNQDGRSNGLTAPNGIAQQAVIRAALHDADVTPAQISYVETHGTGTPLGDPIELQALGAVLQNGHRADTPCAVGSVKTNIGHLEAAAGIAGVIKVILAMQHEAIPPHLHLKEVNPYISLDKLPLSIPTELRSWPRGRNRRFAGVSSFGFGGTNAHVVLEEPPMVDKTEGSKFERPLHILSLSAQSEYALREIVKNYHRHLTTYPDEHLEDLCFTANTGRSHFSHRLAIVAASRSQLEAGLQSYIRGEKTSGISCGQISSPRRRPVVFLFTGQGSQYPEMGRQLYENQPVFRHAVERCAELLASHMDPPLLALLYPSSTTSVLLNQTMYTQPALFALEYALAELWRSWGITPDIVLGHSVGEYAAACIAGIYSLEDGLKLVVERGRMMQHLTQEGQMATVFTDEEHVARVLAPYKQQCAIAAINGPGNIVIAGTKVAVQNVAHILETEKVAVQPLNVSHAFHSPLMEPMLDAFEQVLQQVSYKAPHIPLISSLTGQLLQDIPDSQYWRNHTRHTVQFATAMQTLAERGEHIFLEIGPHPVLLRAGKRCQPAQKGPWLASLQQGQNDWQVMLESLGALYAEGISPDWTGFDRSYSRVRVQLPTYPFERKRYWKEASQNNEDQPEKFDRECVEPHMSNTVLITNGEKLDSIKGPVHDEGMSMQITTPPPSLASLRKEAIIVRLRTMVGGLLQIDASEVDIHKPLLEMGADSLILVEAVRNIERAFGIQLSVRLMFETLTTLDALAIYLEQKSVVEIPVNASASAPVMAEQQPVPRSAPESTQIGRFAGSKASPPPGNVLERIMGQQLELLSQIMTQQLEVLRDAHVQVSKEAAPGPQPATQEAYERPIEASPAASEVPEEAFVPFRAKRPDTLSELQGRQQRHLSDLIKRYTRRTQQSKQLTQATRAVLADVRGTAGFRFSIKEMLYPIIAERAQGSRIWDVDGNEYIDISMGFGVHLFGHHPPFIRKALEGQLQKGIPLGPQALLAGRVAELIHELTRMERVAFTNSGTEAVMTALRLARTATRRTKIALFAGAYHGSFDGVLARVKQDDEQTYVAPLAPGVPPRMIEDVLILDYGSAQSLETIRLHAHELAAVLVEPVQSRRPDLQPGTFLQELRTITREASIALIFDEVITGFRIHPGGAQAWFGIEADIATYGKIVGGGMPIGVVAGKAVYLDGIDGGMWQYGDVSYPQAETTFFAGTFCKHPLTMAAAHAVLEHLKVSGPALQENLNQHTARLATTLNTFFEEEAVPIKVVHFGSLFRFAFSSNMDLFFYHLLERGIYIWEGRNCFLSTAHTEDDIAYLVQAVKESVTEMRSGNFLPEGPTGGKKTGSSSFLPILSEEIGESTSSPVASAMSERNNNATFPAAPGLQTVPLTEAQKQLWVLAQMGDDEASAYNESIAIELKGPFQLAAMRYAFQRVVENHSALRTTISAQGDAQYILPALTLNIPLLDFSDVPFTDRETHLTHYMREAFRQCFDLVHGPLLRVSVAKMEQQRHLLLVTAHHIIVDGWSIGILLRDVCQLYSSACQKQPDHLETAMQFADYIQWQKQHHQHVMKAAETHWLGQFAEAIPTLELPIDHPRPPIKTYNGARLSGPITSNIYAEVKRFSSQQGCTPFMLLFAVYAAYLSRLTGHNDLVIGIPTAGRSLEGCENLVGYCVNLVPVRLHIDQCHSFIEHLAMVKNVLLSAYEHQSYPFAALVKKLNPQRDPSQSPIVTVTFNMDRHVPIPEIFELEGRVITPPLSYAKFDLSLNILEVNTSLLIDLDYNTDLFEESTIARMLGHYHVLLEGVLAQAKQCLWALPLLTATERYELLKARNDTAAPYPKERCFHELFEEQVTRSPETVALQYEDAFLTYSELNRRANQLARYLQKQGIAVGVPVGICIERSIEMVVGLLGILKAGGAFLPLDPAFPQDRIGYMLENAQASLLLTQNLLQERLPGEDIGIKRICLDSAWATIARESDEQVSSKITGDNLAYLIYTSGSTGRPKGVLVPHSGFVNYLVWCADAYGALHGRGAPVQSSIAADAIFPSLFSPLLVGTTVVLMPEERSLEVLSTYLRDQGGFSLMKITPSQLEVLTQQYFSNEDATDWVRTLVAGAEALRGDVLDFWQIHAQGTIVLNEYGPTETVVGCSIYRIPPGSLISGAVPIGLPIANTQFYVLDDHLQPVPVGVPGELYIGGDGVAWGYLNRPELTAEVFIADPFSTTPGARLYKTGDLVRYLPVHEANIEFLGRQDHQVKIRGYRVELGEVEAILIEHPDVHSAVVVAREDVPGVKQLAAYVMLNKQAASSVSKLRGYLQQKLPEYMVPSAFMILDTLPLTATGKVNLRALPSPDRANYELGTTFVPARNVAEELLATIWQRALGIEQVGIYDNFFSLGGDSILAIQIVARANEVGLRLTAKQIFLHQTIAELAATANSAPVNKAEQNVVLGPVPLTPIQHWFFEQQQPDPHHYNQAVILQAQRPLNPDLLKRAIQHLLVHHDALRLRFTQDGLKWYQTNTNIDDAAPLAFIDLSHLHPSMLSASVTSTATVFQASLDLQNGPIMHIALFNCGPQQPQRLLLVVHHLAIDGLSWRILLNDLQTVYQQLDSGQPAHLPAKTTSFQQWAHELLHYARSGALNQDIKYWQILSSIQIPSLPVDFPNGTNTVENARTVSLSLSTEETQALLQRSFVAYNTRINDLLLTALVQTFMEWTHEQTLLVDLEGHGREEVIEHIDLSRTIGWFTSLFPVFLQLNNITEVGDALKSIKEQLRRIPHQGFSYGVLRYLLDQQELWDAAPKAQISFNYLGQFDQIEDELSIFKLAHESSGQAVSPHNKRSYVLDVEGRVMGGALQFDWTYSIQLHRAATIESLAASYLQKLRTIIEHCLQASRSYTPSDFPLAQLAQEQLDHIVADWKDIEDLYPLSPLQQGILFHSLYDLEVNTYFCQACWNLYGSLDVSIFQQAWQQVIERYAILRTSFVWENLDEPLQIVQRFVTLPFEQYDWCYVPKDARHEKLEAFLKEDRKRGFQLSQAPLIRLTLIRLAENSYHFVWSYHHLLLDGWSMPLILQDVFTFYAATIKKQAPELTFSRPYRNYVAWLKEQDLTAAEAFWRQELHGFTACTSLGVDRPQERILDLQDRYSELRWQLSASMMKDLQATAQRHQVTFNALLQAAWALLLNQYSQEEDVLFGVVTSGRSGLLAGIESIVGLLINTLPMRVQITPDADLVDWIKYVQDRQAQVLQYEYTPLPQILRWSEVSGNQPLFKSLLVFENYPLDLSLYRLEEIEIESVALNERTNYPLTLVVMPGPEPLFRIGYDTSCFDAETIERLSVHLQQLLARIVTAHNCPVSTLTLLSNVEKQKFLVDWNETLISYPIEQCLHQYFEAQTQLTPDAIAVSFGPEQITYGELNRHANQLAHFLQMQYVGVETRVAICMERSLGMVISLLSILKAGGTYVPLDPAYPQARLTFLLKDSQPKVLLTQAHLLERCSIAESEGIHVICPEREQTSITRLPQIDLPCRTMVDNLMYIIYTSGSTGIPKGVLATHRSTLNRFFWMWETYPFRTDERCAQKTTLTFVDSVWELWGPLVKGIPVVLIPDETVHEPRQLIQTLAEEEITRLVLVPSLLRPMLESTLDIGCLLSNMQLCVSSGDALPIELMRDFQARLPFCHLLNLYGSSEVAADVTCYEIGASTLPDRLVPVGSPIANSQIYLLDRYLRPVPVGFPGDMYVGGHNLARGYHRRPDLTAERFIPHPFSTESGMRLYMTGDIGRYNAEGTIEYLGRRDQQVKIGGVRIELKEIEAALTLHPAVQEVVVLAHENVPGDKRLIAYYTKVSTATPSISELRQWLWERLPSVMIPAVFVLLERLPLAPSGKVNRLALPAPTGARPELQATFIAPRTPMEEDLADLWAEILHCERPGIYDDFFELGGNSLLAIQFISKIQSLFQVDLSLRELFDTGISTLASMAEYIEHARQTVQAEEEHIALLLERVTHLSDEEIDDLLNR